MWIFIRLELVSVPRSTAEPSSAAALAASAASECYNGIRLQRQNPFHHHSLPLHIDCIRKLFIGLILVILHPNTFLYMICLVPLGSIGSSITWYHAMTRFPGHISKVSNAPSQSLHMHPFAPSGAQK